ncbi:MAG TPA: DsbC family protein, partial [Lysobacter sp.]
GTVAPVVAAQAKPGTPDARAIDAVRLLSPRATVERVGAAQLPGFREAVVEGQVVYVSDDGRHMFVPGVGGALFDVQGKRNLTEDSMASIRKQLLRTIPTSERIVFAPTNPKYTVTIFTDVECGYCRKLHSEIAEYNRQGIAIEYLAFPRMGIGSDDYKKMVAVWCAPDRRKALTDAKNDRPPAYSNCKTSVNQQYDVGRRVGLTGTPMILTQDGEELGGYVPPKALREALDKLAASRARTAAAAKPGA